MADEKDPFAEFCGTVVTAQEDPFKEFGGVVVKKKPTPSGGPNTLPQLNNGFDSSHPFQQPTDLIPVLPEHRAEVRQQQEADAPRPNMGGMIPVKLTKPTKVAPQQFTQTNGSVRKDKSWENLADFVPNVVMGGLQKDMGQAAQFVGENFGMSSNNPLTRFGARLEGVGQKKQDKASQLGLPETVGGTIATTATHFAPDLIELAMTPE